MTKLLLTDSGVRNDSIRTALIDLLGKPIEESDALFVPTGLHPLPWGATQAVKSISGREEDGPLAQLGWKSLGLLELTALPSLGRDRWLPRLTAADALLVEGGDALYLAYWMRETGLADLLPTLDLVYVGLSAGSMVLTPRIGNAFVGWTPPGGGDDTTLGLVDFSIFPHTDHPDLPSNTMAAAERWAATQVPNRAYSTDNETAIKVVDGEAEVISEGTWTLLNP